MLNWVGGRGEGVAMGWSEATGPWRIYRKETDFVDPGPSNSFVFLDEREDTINDAMFVVDAPQTASPTSPPCVSGPREGTYNMPREQVC